MKKLTWIAIKTKGKPIKVNFYTKEGKYVEYSRVKKVVKPTKIEFYKRD